MSRRDPATSAADTILHGRMIHPGRAEGQALVSRMGISFFGGVDPETGIVVEKGHDLEGKCVSGRILVFPSGKGSTVGSYTLYRMSRSDKAPAAILNAECEPITAVGCILAGIPCVDRLPIDRISTGDRIRVDGEAGAAEFVR
jgi:predicted aconitase with swiveling domain